MQRLGAQLVADEPLTGGGGIPLVEQEVHHGENCGQAIAETFRCRDLVGDPGYFDLAFGADQPLGDRCLGCDECSRHLDRRQAAHRAKSQRDPRVESQRGVATGEDQPEAVVLRPGDVVGHRLDMCHEGLLVRSTPLATDHVDRPPLGGRRDPCRGVCRDAVDRPPLHGDQERVLHRVLSQVEVAAEPDQRRDDPARLASEHLLQ